MSEGSVESIRIRLPAFNVGSILVPNTGKNGIVPLIERKPTTQAATIKMNIIDRFIIVP